MPSDYPSFNQDDMLAQVFMAFGQGAGTMLATPAALRAGRAAYGKLFAPDTWEQHAPLTLEFARAIGRLAAHNALQQGASAIGEDDMKAAIQKIHEKQLWPAFCPYCPPIHEWNKILPAAGPGGGGGPIR